MKRLGSKALELAGFKLIRQETFTKLLEDRALVDTKLVPDVYQRLRHIKHLGFDPKVIFDCGAFVGAWTVRVSEIFPDAIFLLVEPN